MTALQILGLLLFIVSIAGVLGYLFQAGSSKDNDQPYIAPTYTKQELDNIKLAEELYDKDLRPIAAKPAQDVEVVEPQVVAKPSKPEFPIDKPKKRRKSNNKSKK
jgi:hypothetical protein